MRVAGFDDAMRSVSWIPLLLAVAGACGDGGTSGTTIDVSVVYDQTWELDEISGSIADRTVLLNATSQIRMTVPDAWAGTEVRIELVGMRDGAPFASGGTTVIPVLGDTLSDEIHLALLSCANTCTEGTSMCKADGVVRCEQRADSCFDWAMPVACAAETPHCVDGVCVAEPGVVRPSNADTIGGIETTGLVRDLPTGLFFDTGTNCLANSMLGNCSPVWQASLPEICVCRLDDLTVRDLVVQGPRTLAILASGSVTVEGTLLIAPGMGATSTTPIDGSAGGSFGTRGGGESLAAYGSAALIPLLGGSGGGGDNSRGGGALQITANGSLRVSGAITASGGGGAPNPSRPCRATGGGSGGGLLLEATTVELPGLLAANGGGGSGGRLYYSGSTYYVCGTAGNPGQPSVTNPATGGVGSNACEGFYYGGPGGDGSIGDAAGIDGGGGSSGSIHCTNGNEYTGAPGAGGGGAGRIRINTPTGGCAACATTSPTATFGTLQRELPL